MSYKHGIIAEEFFTKMLYSRGIDYKFVDDWYDYEIQGLKVELKSCTLTIKKGGDYIVRDGNSLYRIGRLDFTKEENRAKIIKENVWVAIVVRHQRQCIFYGFVEGKELKDIRYISIHKLREYTTLSFNDWVSHNNIIQTQRGCPYCRKGMVLE